MKKSFPFKSCLSFALALALAACSSGNDDEPTPPQVETPKIEITSPQPPPVIDSKGGSATVTFTTTDSWTTDVTAATRAIDWCSVSPTSGTAGSHSLTITTTANNTYDERRATITLRSGQTTKSFTVAQKQTNALTVTSNKIEIGASGGEATIEVKANVNYQYDIEESARTWISVANTRSLSTSTLRLNIAENDNVEKREGTITIQSGDLSEKVTVYQEGSKPTIVLSQNEYTVSSEGEIITIELKSNIDYEVQLPTEDWITESETRALSSHTHHFIVATNEEYDARTAEITFINKENNLTEKVKVTQMQCDALIVAQNEYTVPATGGNLDFTVSTNVEFAVESSTDWIKQVTTRGLTEKVLRFTVEENTSDDAREGTITVSKGDLKQTIKVRQQAKAVFSISCNEVTVGADGEHIQVEVTSNGEYTVQLPNVEWVTETTTRGAETHTHTFCIAANETYDSRTTEIAFADKATGNIEKLKITQMQRDAIIVAQNEYTVPAAGGTLDFTVSTNVDFDVESSVDWIKQVSTRGLTEKVLRFNVKENNTGASREATITLKTKKLEQVINITQEDLKPYITIASKQFNVSADGGCVDFAIDSNVNVEVFCAASWCYLVQQNDKEYFFEIENNRSVKQRETQIIVKNEQYGLSETINIVQEAFVPQMELLTQEIIVGAEESIVSLEKNVKTNIDYTITIEEKGLLLWELDDKNLIIHANTTESRQQIKVTIANKEYSVSHSFILIQEHFTFLGLLTNNGTYKISSNEGSYQIPIHVKQKVTAYVEQNNWMTVQVVDGFIELKCTKNISNEKRKVYISFEIGEFVRLGMELIQMDSSVPEGNIDDIINVEW